MRIYRVVIIKLMCLIIAGCTQNGEELKKTEPDTYQNLLSESSDPNKNKLKESNPTPKNNDIKDVIPSCEEIHKPQMPNSISGNLIRASEVKVGDKIMGVTIRSINRSIPGYSTENMVEIQFCGNLEVAGKFTYYANHEYFSNKIAFTPDQSSIDNIPTLEIGTYGKQPILIQDPSNVIKESLGNPEISGSASFKISDLTIRNAEGTEIWNTAKLESISNVHKYAVALLSDGTELYENQPPFTWYGHQIQVINNGTGIKQESLIQEQIESQIKMGTTEEEIDIITEEKIKITSDSEYIFTMVNHQQKEKLILLLRKNHPTEKNIKMIYSIVILTDRPEQIKKELVKLADNWKPSSR
ncbi:hypothetical protein QFZ77_007555 [Paenibacillus sp. V4I3]|uniref:hypothetical protein n=1 Tax=Paenibacillus sp. V4I3 TaxID=3042305 RepID=UPI00278A5864|nr:hypothetical protein [Paenibacillus sp. V4I3]MDQ0878896.1 hypothetical protein [Paenibacillus sp. V4I3]